MDFFFLLFNQPKSFLNWSLIRKGCHFFVCLFDCLFVLVLLSRVECVVGVRVCVCVCVY